MNSTTIIAGLTPGELWSWSAASTAWTTSRARALLIEDQGLRPRCPRPGTKRRYWTYMKLIIRTHRYTLRSSGSQVAPIAAEEDIAR
jgi:hypothetical protein